MSAGFLLEDPPIQAPRNPGRWSPKVLRGLELLARSQATMIAFFGEDADLSRRDEAALAAAKAWIAAKRAEIEERIRGCPIAGCHRERGHVMPHRTKGGHPWSDDDGTDVF